MMKKIIFFLSFTLLFYGARLSGQVSIQASSGIEIAANGAPRIEVDGDFQNMGLLTPDISTILLNGTTDQALRNDNGAFYNLSVDKSGGDVIVEGNFSTNMGTLSVVSGDVDLNGQIITLDATALLSETAGNTVKGTAGYMTTTRNINNPASDNIGGLGLELTSAEDFGGTEVRRGHTEQVSGAATSIWRYFEVLPGNGGLTADLTFRYDESELNGQVEADLQLYQSFDGGTTWMYIGGTANPGTNALTATGVTLSGRLTLSDECLEGAGGTQAICTNTTVMLDANGMASITVEDVDGGSTGACGIASLTASPLDFSCADVGNNDVTVTVTDVAGNSSSCTAIVTVEDNLAPEITLCQGGSVAFNGEESLASSSAITIEANDVCGVGSITYDPEFISCEQIGQTVAVTVTVTDVNGNESDCTANIVVSGLPCGWMDVGDDGIGCEDGSDTDYSASSEAFTLTSEGCASANWSSDAAAYVSYEICGDGEIIAHVASLSPLGGGWAGISARESEAPGSKKVALATNLGNYGRREIRTTTNGYAIPQQFFRPGANWLKLSRTGNQFIGSMSFDGVNWQIVLVSSVPMTPCIQFGLYVTNLNSGALTATFDNVEVTESTMPSLSVLDTNQSGVDAQSFTNQDFSIFPNPAKEEIHLDLSSYSGQEVQVEILNQLGQSILQRKIAEVGSSTERFNLNGWSDGTYLVRVVKDQEQQIKKFVIVK